MRQGLGVNVEATTEIECLKPVLLRLSCAHKFSPGERGVLVKMQCLIQSSGWGLRVCISNKPPGGIGTAGPWTTL